MAPAEKSSISIIQSIPEAQVAIEEMIKFTENVPFVGLDCEWVGTNTTALLQLAVFSDSGAKCYLFRGGCTISLIIFSSILKKAYL